MYHGFSGFGEEDLGVAGIGSENGFRSGFGQMFFAISRVDELEDGWCQGIKVLWGCAI